MGSLSWDSCASLPGPTGSILSSSSWPCHLQSPAKAVFQTTDVRDWQHLERMFHVASRHFGAVDIVCPGAGVYEPPFSNFWHPPGKPPSKDSPTSNRYASLDINLTHPIRTTQLAISHFLSSKHPTPFPKKSIVHISSIAGQTTPLPGPIYNATKHAINGFVRSLAPLDSRLGIRVTAVAPGVIKTPLWTDNPEKLKMLAEDDAWVTPEFVADVMVSLVENESVHVSAGLAAAGRQSGAGGSGGGTEEVNVKGGMILEVAKGRVRVVEQFNDVGPSGEGNTVGNMGVVEEEILKRLEAGEWDGD
ncbi:hypothetical protein BDR22DRAFT_250420 [Usnea florida]